jgi:hypothetical protein
MHWEEWELMEPCYMGYVNLIAKMKIVLKKKEKQAKKFN